MSIPRRSRVCYPRRAPASDKSDGTPDSFAKDRDAVAVITKALGDSENRSSSPAVPAIFGVFTKGEASPTIFDED